MFIHPKRSLIEERNGGICDVNRFIAVGRPDSSFIGLSIGAQELGETIFANMVRRTLIARSPWNRIR